MSSPLHEMAGSMLGGRNTPGHSCKKLIRDPLIRGLTPFMVIV